MKSTLTNLIKEVNKDLKDYLDDCLVDDRDCPIVERQMIASFLEQQIRKTWRAARKLTPRKGEEK